MGRKLAFDPTPESTALALRIRYKYVWKLIRDERFGTPDYHCEICGSDRGKREWLDGHEVYSFKEPKIIRLEKVVFICKHCHEAIHLERTRLFSGKEWVAEVEAHYCRVNGITAEEMKADYAAYFEQSPNRQDASQIPMHDGLWPVEGEVRGDRCTLESKRHRRSNLGENAARKRSCGTSRHRRTGGAEVD